MNAQYGFWLEPGRCIQCWACQVACKAWKGIKAGSINIRRVVDVWSGTFPNVRRTFISMSCMHCAKPACAGACPANAIKKRSVDGIVLVDQSRCTGCHSCLTACPFGAPQFDADGVMNKCDYCLDRLAVGQQPACVATCPTRALHGGTMEELSRLASNRAGARLVGATQPSLFVSQ
jgi:anaerobic dimethyl sulfoxide reductase subunit B (iron-sulfur subunit)